MMVKMFWCPLSLSTVQELLPSKTSPFISKTFYYLLVCLYLLCILIDTSLLIMVANYDHLLLLLLL